MQNQKPRIAVIGTGGSISTPARHSLDLFEYGDYGKVIEVDELLALFPVIGSQFDVIPVRFRALNSCAISPEDWLDLNRKVSEVVEGDPTIVGVVVSHGTATLEETSYFLHLGLKTNVPVVVVGSQRPPNALGSDAGINLVNALRVAASTAARGLGVLVVMNDEVQSAREVTKAANFRLHAFRSPDCGVLGYADPDGTVAIYRRPTRRHAPNTEFEVRNLKHLPPVEIVYSYAGVDGRLIEAAVKNGNKGIIVAGMPPGLTSPAQRQAMIEASRRSVLVVQSSRAGSGRVGDRGINFEPGIIGADNLNPQKARVLAMLALTVSEDRDNIRRVFREY